MKRQNNTINGIFQKLMPFANNYMQYLFIFGRRGLAGCEFLEVIEECFLCEHGTVSKGVTGTICEGNGRSYRTLSLGSLECHDGPTYDRRLYQYHESIVCWYSVSQQSSDGGGQSVGRGRDVGERSGIVNRERNEKPCYVYRRDDRHGKPL
jgi:hypothetical protein